ncbi:unnamed protein product [Cuscuta epithymum]|uniref:Uncharacterized protein n=1 Tax=Cuscuta epithymum TaxID=186058 RepID=A0AAV0DVI5_9ASTE|nr:unnamed protein product [Cuscuta epithymum]CAH9110856.1 unnamed protein product [Cuscuta epithymum]
MESEKTKSSTASAAGDHGALPASPSEADGIQSPAVDILPAGDLPSLTPPLDDGEALLSDSEGFPSPEWYLSPSDTDDTDPTWKWRKRYEGLIEPDSDDGFDDLESRWIAVTSKRAATPTPVATADEDEGLP